MIFLYFLVLNKMFCCSYKSHNIKTVNSPFPKEEIPEKWMRADPNDEKSNICKMCYHCRLYSRNLRKKASEEAEKSNKESNLGYCSSCHHTNISDFPRDKVPINQLRKDPEDSESEIFKTCIQCRNYDKKKQKSIRDKHKELAKTQQDFIKEGSAEFGYCSSKHHTDYPRDKVPIKKLRKVPDNPKNELSDTCIDCKLKASKKTKKIRLKAKQNAEEKGKKICNTCLNEVNGENKQCKKCKEYSIYYKEKLKEERKEIIFDIIKETQVGCYKCKCLFFSPDEGTTILKQIPTYLKEDNNRYFILNDKEYCVKKDFELFKKYLITPVIEFDHLSEKEQRERGLLNPDEKYIPKVAPVGNLISKSNKKLESLKCQHLCCKCHIEETIRRELENQKTNNKSEKQENTNKNFILKEINTTRELIKKKKEYVNKIKESGCSNCGYTDKNLLRFFEFDHIFPEEKISAVSTMIYKYNNKFTFDDVVSECEKCRVLCRFCHIVNTLYQKGYTINYFEK